MKENNQFPVDPRAEKFSSGLAVAFLIIFCVLGAIMLFGGLIAAIFVPEIEAKVVCVYLAFVALFIIVSGLACWAYTKMFINISRNLFVIRELISAKEEKKAEEI